MNARKTPMESKEAWDFLTENEKVLIARGKKVIEFSPSAEHKEEILKQSLGRSGTLRAPTLKIGTTSYVGFNVDMYEKITGS